jgi:hypothetical protein
MGISGAQTGRQKNEWQKIKTVNHRKRLPQAMEFVFYFFAIHFSAGIRACRSSQRCPDRTGFAKF